MSKTKKLTKLDLINPDMYCLLLTVDDGNSLNNQRLLKTNEFSSRNYINESIRCIKAWRRNGGYLKDIDIIVDYIGQSELSKEVLEIYSKYNVSGFNSYEKYKEILKEFDYGFIGVHLSGQELSFNLKNIKPIIIHIDLDMELLQPIPDTFFVPLLDKECIIGGYRDEDLPSQRTPLFNEAILNSDMIITKRFDYSDFIIYPRFLHSIRQINKDYKKYQVPSDKEYRLFDIEEYGVDKVYAENKDKFHVVKEDSYEQGEGYFEVQNIDLTKVYFWHEHILDKPNDYFTKQKIKLIRAIKNAKK